MVQWPHLTYCTPGLVHSLPVRLGFVRAHEARLLAAQDGEGHVAIWQHVPSVGLLVKTLSRRCQDGSWLLAHICVLAAQLNLLLLTVAHESSTLSLGGAGVGRMHVLPDTPAGGHSILTRSFGFPGDPSPWAVALPARVESWITSQALPQPLSANALKTLSYFSCWPDSSGGSPFLAA